MCIRDSLIRYGSRAGVSIRIFPRIFSNHGPYPVIFDLCCRIYSQAGRWCPVWPFWRSYWAQAHTRHCPNGYGSGLNNDWVIANLRDNWRCCTDHSDATAFYPGSGDWRQWGGAMLLVTESAPADQRGWYGAYAQAGAPVGVILANLAFIIISRSVSDEFFMAWGWRIPFLASVALIGISMYVQLNLEDTKAFKELEAQREKRQFDATDTYQPVKRSPVLEAIRKYPKRIALAAGAFLSVQVSFYILIAFIISYGIDPDGANVSRNTMLAALLIASALQIPAQFWASGYSDRHGRRGIFMLGAILTGVWAFALFPLVATGNFLLIVLGICGGLVFLGFMYGPQAAFFTELFSTEVRYSGASLGYQLGAILGGAFAPTIAVYLWREYAIVWVSVYIAVASVLALLSVLMLTETYKTSLSATE